MPEVEIDRAALDALGPAAAPAPALPPGRGADGLPLYDPRNGPPRSHVIGRFAEDPEAPDPALLRRPPPRAAAEAGSRPTVAVGTPPAPSIPGAMPERPARVPPMPALPGDLALPMETTGPAAPPLPPAPAPVAEDGPPAEAVAALGEPETMETPPASPAPEPEGDAADPPPADPAPETVVAHREPEPEDMAAETPAAPPAVETPPADPAPEPEDMAAEAIAGEEPAEAAETPPAAPASEPEGMAAETPPAPLPLPTPTVDEVAAAQDAAVAEPPPTLPPPDGAVRIVFAGGDGELSDMAQAVLDNVAGALAADPTLRIVLKAYASAEDTTASAARRLSLMRALAARRYLIDAGIDATRIDVRALGAKYEDGPPDRVDIVGLA